MCMVVCCYVYVYVYVLWLCMKYPLPMSRSITSPTYMSFVSLSLFCCFDQLWCRIVFVCQSIGSCVTRANVSMAQACGQQFSSPLRETVVDTQAELT